MSDIAYALLCAGFGIICWDLLAAVLLVARIPWYPRTCRGYFWSLWVALLLVYVGVGLSTGLILIH